MKKIISFFSLKKQYFDHKKNFLRAIETVLQNQNFIGGAAVETFEKRLRQYVGVNFAVSCNSGTDALWLALRALNLPKNSIVLTTPFSFIASSSEIVAHGAHPVFIDIDEKTYNIDPEKIEEWIEQNTIEQPFEMPLCGSSGQTGEETKLINNNQLSSDKNFSSNNITKKINDSLLPFTLRSCKATSRRVHKQTGYPVVGILPVDIFGQCANYKKIKEIADKHNLWIIQDACQAIGAKTPEEKMAGTLGDISCFSFYPTKNLGAFGDGGCCTTNNEYLAEKLLQLRNHGRKSHYNYIQLGINSRLDGIQTAILSTKLEFLDKLNEARIRIAQTYDEKLKDIEFLQLPNQPYGKHVYHQYCVKIKDERINREIFAQELKDKGIETNIYYPRTLNKIDFLNTDERLKTECPVAQKTSETILALPIWPELEMENVKYICEQISALGLRRGAKEELLCRQKVI